MFGVWQPLENNPVCMHRNATFPKYLSNSMLCSVSSYFTANRWIWTRNNQLLNVRTLKCLGMARTSSYIDGIGLVPRVFFKTCNASDDRQLWQCQKKCFFQNKKSKTYMNYGNSISQLVLLFHGTGSYSCWTRYPSTRETLCSQTSSYIGKLIV